MSITLDHIKELREKTGAGMGDCKKALGETEGDMAAAVEYLRKRGAASAAKRADRSSNEGLVLSKTSDDGKIAAIVEVNCETDFVARNEEFERFANAVLDVVYQHNPDSWEAALTQAVDTDTLGDLLNETLAKFSERIVVSRFERLETKGFITAYTHVGSKLGVLLEVSSVPADDAGNANLRDIAMQVAAMSPSYVNREEVDATTIEKEKDIYRSQAIDSGKPENIAERMATGKLNKFFQESCLVEQSFVKDASKTVADVLEELTGADGAAIKVLSFRRYSLGDSSQK